MKPMAARTDGEVKQDVEAELRCNPDVDETYIAVEVMWGTVRLSGYVRNPFDKYGAEDAVRRVAGVSTVANDIIVRPASTAGAARLR
jgi:osmotically-inducible protein OsmY